MSNIKFSIFYFLFLFINYYCIGQKTTFFDEFKLYNDSSINNNQTNNNKINSNEKIENIYVVGKIWGFLKYYHPAIAKGNYNWDYELLRILPKILDKKFQQRDSILAEWIENLGDFEIEIDNIMTEPNNVVLYPDLSWIETSGFEPNLVELLEKVRYAKRSNTHYYISFSPPSAGNPIFKNEINYTEMIYPDIEYRLLCLIRYWNIINYYFPYKYLIDDNWEQVFADFIARFINVRNEIEYLLTTSELVAKIKDSHAYCYTDHLLDSIYGINILPAKISFIGDTAVVTGFFCDDFEKKMNFNKGDIILKINEKEIKDIITERAKIIPASNYPTLLRSVAATLFRTNENSLHIEYFDGIAIQQCSVPTFERTMFLTCKKSDTCFMLLEPNISYLYINSLKEEYLPHLWKYIENTEGLIIDLRNYPVSFIVYSLGSYLMRQPTPFAKSSMGSIMQPGTFTYKPILKVGIENSNYYRGKVERKWC